MSPSVLQSSGHLVTGHLRADTCLTSIDHKTKNKLTVTRWITVIRTPRITAQPNNRRRAPVAYWRRLASAPPSSHLELRSHSISSANPWESAYITLGAFYTIRSYAAHDVT
jgi:hypothetical protein